MSDFISVSKHHFIGDGPKPFLVSGRIPEDDDDTVHLVMAEDEGDATDVFSQELIADAGLQLEDIERLEGKHGGESVFIINCYALA